MHWIYLIHEFHNLIWITEINELFHNILIYWDAPVLYFVYNDHSRDRIKFSSEAIFVPLIWIQSKFYLL